MGYSKIKYLLVAMNGMEINDGIFLLLAKLTTLNVRSKVIGPSQSAAFATSS